MFTGWLRKTRHHRWRPVCQGGTLDETHGKLLQAAREQKVTDSLCRLMTRSGFTPAEEALRYDPE